MTREEVLGALRQSKLSRLAAQLEAFVHPSIRLTTRVGDPARLALGASRFGGVPDWPAGTRWPEHGGRPLAFLAQIRLSDCTRFPECAELGLSGWLYFFYDAEAQPWGFDPADRGRWRVLHVDRPLDDLERADGARVPESSRFRLCALEFELEYRLPPADVICGTLDLDFSARQERDFDALLERVNAPDGTNHRMFGWPDEIQADMRLECELASNGLYCGDSSGYEDPRAAGLEARQFDWLLLMQIDTDENGPGWMWGDCGRVYFWIREQDLAAGDFARVWLVLQCY